MKLSINIILGIGFFLITDIAQACSVCGFGEDGSRWAFIFTTGLMTLVPLLMLGGGIYFVYKKSKKAGAIEK